jgi:hypothetical protein
MSSRPSLRPGERGQASTEFVALAALVLVALTGAAWAAAGFSGAGVVNAVNSGIRRAICVASGDDCADFHVQQPCTVAVDEDKSSKGVSIAIWRLGKDRAITVERRSDGSVAVTAYDDVDGGAGLSIGARFSSGRSKKGDRGGGGRPGVVVERKDDGPVSIEGRLRGGWGRTWELPPGADVAAFVGRIKSKERVRAPDVDRVRLGGSASISAGGEVEHLGSVSAGAHVALSGEGTRDRRTGRITASIAISGSVAAGVAGPLGLKLGGSMALEPSATLVLDRDGRPRELQLFGSLADRDGSRRRDVRMRVDLTRPAVKDGVELVLGGLLTGRPGQVREVAGILARWAADEGWIDEREYGTASETDGFDHEIALGLKLGLRAQDTHTSDRLLRARSHPPGGLWEDRTDCVRRG